MEQGILHDVPDPWQLDLPLALPVNFPPPAKTQDVMGSLLAETRLPPPEHGANGPRSGTTPTPLKIRDPAISVAVHDEMYRLHNHVPHNGGRVMVRGYQPDLPLRPDSHLQLLRLLRLRLQHHAVKR